MAATVAPVTDPDVSSEPANRGLRRDAIGFASGVVIGVASTAPAYSLAATLGLVVAVTGVGTHAPAVMLVSFVPMFCISVAYRALNRVDPDCGTTFAWVTRAMGPWAGWLSGFAVFAADVIVMATLSEIAGKYFFRLVGWNSAASSTAALAIAAVCFIALMTWVTYRGVELSARVQQALLGIEVVVLVVFAAVALVKVYAEGPAGSIHPSLAWLNPFALSWSALVDGVLLGVFIYWGWDACVTVNEESRDSATGPGRAAVVSTLVLLGIFVLVSTAGQSVAGPGFLAAHSTDVLSVLGTKVFGSPWDKLLILVVLTSTAASTQTTIMPTARTMLSMSRWGALPAALGRIHPRFQTPALSTLLMGAISATWTVALLVANPAQSVLGDSITALGFLIAFYYGMTGLACVIYYRHVLRRRVGSLLSLGVIPGAGALMLAAIFVKAFTHYSQHEIGGQLVNYAAPVAGIEVPIVIGFGSLALGIVLMLAAARLFRPYFRRRPEALAATWSAGDAQST
ncbi:MAG TPA: APC family permease [Solirubrobacteraceae bacterium]|nr:APC family permease [Solirubrobacteraceae bacterium]